MLKIKKAEDFGLGFNCMTRLYMDGYDEEILIDMLKVCEEYLKWFSQRTMVCSLRDLVKDYSFGWNEERIPKNQVERYEMLIKMLIRQAICREELCSHHKNERWIIISLCDDIGLINSILGKEKGFDYDTFYQWVVDNGLDKKTDIKEVKKDETSFYKIDSDTWIYMQEDLEAELLTREIFYVASRKEGNVKELRNLLKELMKFDMLHTQKDCLYMYHQIRGVERYLLSRPNDVNMEKLLNQLEKGKKVIAEKT